MEDNLLYQMIDEYVNIYIYIFIFIKILRKNSNQMFFFVFKKFVWYWFVSLVFLILKKETDDYEFFPIQ